MLAYPSRLNGPAEAMQKGIKALRALRARSYAQARDGLVWFGLSGRRPDKGSVGWAGFEFDFEFPLLILSPLHRRVPQPPGLASNAGYIRPNRSGGDNKSVKRAELRTSA